MSQYEEELYEYGPGYEVDGQETGWGELGYEMPASEFQELEQGYELEAQESPLTEVEEMELASELLEVASEEELEEFLGKLIRSVGRAAGTALRSPIGRQLTGLLKQAMPIAGGALGSMLLPGVGGMVGSRL